jgi:DNA invertase Pin-like site-specific DNA recombinase
MTRAVIYCRISRDRIGAGLGVERQEADCRALAVRLGFTVLLVLVDNDLSAYSGKPRPGYKRLLEMIAGGEVDVVLAWHGDRLHRSVSELETYIGVCEARDVPTYTATAGELDLTTATGRMHARIAGAVARHEVEHSIERQQAAKLQAAVSGKWGGGRRPYGFEADGVTVRPAEAAVVAASIDSILNGSSLRALAADLNERGLTTSTGRAWQPSELRKVLTRARNAGLREHRGAIIGKAEWPAIVPEEKWRAATSILTDPARRTSHTTARRWMLSNVALCGVCGGPLRVTLLSTTRGGVPSYTCTAGRHVVRQAVELEAFISAVVVERLSRPDAIDLLRPTSKAVDVGALWAEQTALNTRLDDLADDLELDERTLARRTKALRARLSEISDTLTEAGRGNVFSGVVDAPDVAAAWDRLDLARRRGIVDTLMTVTVHRTKKGRPAGWRPGDSYFNHETVEITWRTM